MPSKTQRQHNLMAMAANDAAFAKRKGIPQEVAREFLKADKGKKFPRKSMKDPERKKARYG